MNSSRNCDLGQEESIVFYKNTYLHSVQKSLRLPAHGRFMWWTASRVRVRTGMGRKGHPFSLQNSAMFVSAGQIRCILGLSMLKRTRTTKAFLKTSKSRRAFG